MKTYWNNIGFLIILFSLPASSQWIDSSYTDKGSIIPIDSTEQQNTESGNFIFKEKDKNENFYDTLYSKANKHNWSKELYRLIIRDLNTVEKPDKTERVSQLTDYSDKIIRNITIKQLDVFGPSMSDTGRKAELWPEKLGNSLHVSTNLQYIKNSLIIEEGERFDPYIIADNERILRNIPGLQDAHFIIVPVEGEPELVDIMIITKDVMAFGFSWEAYDLGYGQASIWNTNLMGLGHNLKYTSFYNINSENKYGYNIFYKINNISNSFANLEFQHTKKHDIENTIIQAERGFITPEIRFGGGGGYGKVKSLFDLETIDTIFPQITSNYEYYDGWLGYSFPVRRMDRTKVRKSYFFTGRVLTYNFFERPEVSKSYLYNFYRRSLFLGSVGLTWQGYHTTSRVYGFGKTEDLPYGAMIKITGGYEQNEFLNRPYLGATLTYAKCMTKYGYITNSIELGGFYNDKIEQGAIKYNLLHITPLLGKARHQFRNFLSVDYLQGINRYQDEFILFEEENGIRGLNDRYLKGDKRFSVNNEFNYYSPHNIYGFKFIYFIYADVGIINHSRKALVDNPIYISSGIGVKIRNERLVFNTIQLQFNFFPLSPGIDKSNKELIKLTSYPQYRMPEFAIRKPELIEY